MKMCNSVPAWCVRKCQTITSRLFSTKLCKKIWKHSFTFLDASALKYLWSFTVIYICVRMRASSSTVIWSTAVNEDVQLCPCVICSRKCQTRWNLCLSYYLRILLRLAHMWRHTSVYLLVQDDVKKSTTLFHVPWCFRTQVLMELYSLLHLRSNESRFINCNLVDSWRNWSNSFDIDDD